MEDVDHIAARVSVLAVVGGLAGAANAAMRGHNALRWARLTAVSCAMTGTACFSMERIASLVYRRFFLPSHDNNNHHSNHQATVLTHAIGGMFGGAVMGTLYLRRPLRGMVFLTPVMTLVGMGEHLFQEMRQERIQEEEKLKRSASQNQ